MSFLTQVNKFEIEHNPTDGSLRDQSSINLSFSQRFALAFEAKCFFFLPQKNVVSSFMKKKKKKGLF